jgi:hypothetical protein
MILPNIPQSFQDSREIAEYHYRKKPADSTKNANEKAIDTGRSRMISYPPNRSIKASLKRIPP